MPSNRTSSPAPWGSADTEIAALFALLTAVSAVVFMLLAAHSSVADTAQAWRTLGAVCAALAIIVGLVLLAPRIHRALRRLPRPQRPVSIPAAAPPAPALQATGSARS